MRKVRSYAVSAIADNGAEIDLNVGASHTIEEGETLTFDSASTASQDGVYIVDDKDTNEIQVYNTVSTSGTGTLYSNQWELLFASTSGKFRLGEMRSGFN